VVPRNFFFVPFEPRDTDSLLALSLAEISARVVVEPFSDSTLVLILVGTSLNFVLLPLVVLSLLLLVLVGLRLLDALICLVLEGLKVCSSGTLVVGVVLAVLGDVGGALVVAALVIVGDFAVAVAFAVAAAVAFNITCSSSTTSSASSTNFRCSGVCCTSFNNRCKTVLSCSIAYKSERASEFFCSSSLERPLISMAFSSWTCDIDN